MYDLIIRNGTIVDGTGRPGYVADLAVSGGNIAAIGQFDEKALKEFDASGFFVTPGFIDIHTHFDGQATWDDSLEPIVWHGVTTAILGNCGVGFAPAKPGDRKLLIDMMDSVEDIPAEVMESAMRWNWESYPEYLSALDGLPRTMDLASMITHLSVRIFVMGDRVYDNPTAEDIEAMANIVREAMAAGAVGLSMSRTVLHTTKDGQPLPGTFAEESELVALARAVREGGNGKGVLEVSPASTTYPEPNSLESEIALLARVSRQADCPVVFTFLQNNHDPADYERALTQIAEANNTGARLHPAIICRPVSIMMNFDSDLQPFANLPSFAPLKTLPLAEKVQALSNPVLRAKLLSEEISDPKGLDMIFADPGFWAHLFNLGEPVNYYPRADQSLQAQAERKGISPKALAYDLMLEDEGRNFIVYAVTNWAERSRKPIHKMLTFPSALVGLGDAGAHLTAVVDGSQPTTLLADWVRPDQVGDDQISLDIEFAIRKLTLDNASIFGLSDRGELAVGKRADINIIELGEIAVERPCIRRDLPGELPRLDQRARGYVATLVKGEVIQRNGVLENARPGRVARPGG